MGRRGAHHHNPWSRRNAPLAEFAGESVFDWITRQGHPVKPRKTKNNKKAVDAWQGTDRNDSEPNYQVRNESMINRSVTTTTDSPGWVQLTRETFDDGTVAVTAVMSGDGPILADVQFDGGGRMNSDALRAIADRYEKLPAWLRAMADALDSETAGEYLAHTLEAQATK